MQMKLQQLENEYAAKLRSERLRPSQVLVSYQEPDSAAWEPTELYLILLRSLRCVYLLLPAGVQ